MPRRGRQGRLRLRDAACYNARMKRKVHRIAGSLAERLSRLEGVQAVLLGDAADIEVFDPYFTIDLDVYTAGAPPGMEARSSLLPDMQAFETSPVAAIDRFLVEELPASVHYVRSADVDRMLLRIAEQSWVFHEPGTNALYRIERGEVLFSRDGWLEEARSVLAHVPSQFWWQARLRAFSLAERALSDLGAAAHRSDDLFFLVSGGAPHALRGKLSVRRKPAVRAFGPDAVGADCRPARSSGRSHWSDGQLHETHRGDFQGCAQGDRRAHRAQPHAPGGGGGVRKAAYAGLLAAVALLVLGCSGKFESFRFQTAEGVLIEIRESPSRARDQERHFQPTPARPATPVYSLATPTVTPSENQSFQLAYTSSIRNGTLAHLLRPGHPLKSVPLPPSSGTLLRYLVPLAKGDQDLGLPGGGSSAAAGQEALDLAGSRHRPIYPRFRDHERRLDRGRVRGGPRGVAGRRVCPDLRGRQGEDEAGQVGDFPRARSGFRGGKGELLRPVKERPRFSTSAPRPGSPAGLCPGLRRVPPA